MKALRFICHDGEPDVPPLIVIFEVSNAMKSEDAIEIFGKALHEYVPGSEDCPPIRFAADKVCKEYGASVEFYEADQEFSVPESRCVVCPECCVPLSDDNDSTSHPHTILALAMKRKCVGYAIALCWKTGS